MPDAPQKTFLEEIQSLDQATKQKVLIIASASIMAIIVFLWMAYFNTLIGGAPGIAVVSQMAAPATVSAPSASGPSVWQDIAHEFNAIVNFFKSPRQYEIKPQ